MIDTKHLRVLAEAATPGPWMRLFGERTVYDRMEDGCRGIAIVRSDYSPPTQKEAANIDYIAACSPDVLLALLDAQDIIERLNRGVSVEPSYYWEPDGTIEWMKEGSGFSTNTGPAHGWKITHYYTAEALAAARVQMANEIMELPQIKGNLFAEKAIRALIGGANHG